MKPPNLLGGITQNQVCAYYLWVPLKKDWPHHPDTHPLNINKH